MVFMKLTIGVLCYHALTTADGFVVSPSISMRHILGHCPTPTSFLPSSKSSSAGRPTKLLPLFCAEYEDHYPHDQHPSAPQQAILLPVPRRMTTPESENKREQYRQFDHDNGKRASSFFSFFRASRILISRAVGSLVFGLSAYVTRGMMGLENCSGHTKPPPPYVSALVGVILLVGVGVIPCRKDGIRHWYQVDDEKQQEHHHGLVSSIPPVL